MAENTARLIAFAKDAETSAGRDIPVRILHDGVYYDALMIGKKGGTFQLATDPEGRRIDAATGMTPTADTSMLAAIKQDAEWAREILESDGHVAGRSTGAGDRALTYIERIEKRAGAAGW